MMRPVCRVLLFAGLLAAVFAPGLGSAQSMKKRGGPVVDLDGYKSQAFDYWKADKDKAYVNKFTITDPKDKSSAEIIVKELGSNETSNDVFDALKKRAKTTDGDDLKEVTDTKEIKKDDPKITQMVIRRCNYTPDTPKAKEQKDVQIVAVVVETKDKKYLVRVIGNRILLSTMRPDIEKFLTDLKK